MSGYPVSSRCPLMSSIPEVRVADESPAVDSRFARTLRTEPPRRAVVAPQTGPAGAPSRAPRGPALSRCAGERTFRECRGGEALRSTSRSYRVFDQYRYEHERGIDHRATCEGWVREVMRRIDRSGEAVPQSLLAIAQQMRNDATRRSDETASRMFARVGAYQVNASLLALPGLRWRLTERVPPGTARDSAIKTTLGHLRDDLGEREVAFLRIALNAAGASGIPGSAMAPDTEYGHALLVQRLPDNEYAIFDPNNGAFVYSSFERMREALEEYLKVAFRDPATALEAVPDSIEFFGQSRSSQAAPPPQAAPLQGPPGSSLPRAESGVGRLLAATAQESNELSGDALSAAAGDARPIAHASQGIACLALREVAQVRAPTLMQATGNIWQRLADEARRSDSIDEIEALQEQNRYGLLTDIPHRTRRPGALRISVAPRLIDDLRLHFDESRDAEDSRRPYRNDFAELRLTFRNPPTAAQGAGYAGSGTADGYSIIVQRLGLADDFRHDRYELQEPISGVFRYANFNAMSDALTSAINDGYPEAGGVAHVDTVYFGHPDDHAGPHQPAAAPHESPAANITLGGVEPLLAINGSPSQTPPLVLPVAQPDFGFDEPPETLPRPGSNWPHIDLKRSTNYMQDRKPYALFRPSTATPAELEARGGFSSEQVAMRNVNLDLHNFDVVSNPKLLDSAGYLGIFRRERAAAERLTDTDGYVYLVAPTPNMLDVNSSLGSYVRRPESFEVAAMGRIDYAQIRGWRAVNRGVPGKFVRNPKYRWDIYNQTRIAGAQPQLSRLPIGNGAWNQSGYRAFVSRDTRGAAIAFKQDLNKLHAQFYDNAWEKVRHIEAQQAAGLDYRGPLTIEAYGGNDTQGTHLYISAYGVPEVASKFAYAAKDPASRHEFTMGDDGRFHLVKDHAKVLRVGSDGNVYLGKLPSDLNSTNGVFNYMNSLLVHLEDGKFLTVEQSNHQPFVTDASAGVRSQWALRKPNGNPAIPPRINEYTFRGLTGGQHRLFRFETDPDSALPDTTTHFVTKVPGKRGEGNFLAYADWIPFADVRDISKWLYENNAAWLFLDGYYVTAPAPGRLEAHTLDGVLHWWAEFDPWLGTAKFGQRTLSSSYRISEETMNRIRRQAARRERVSTLLE
jgi:hypothetical protein